MTRVAGVKRSVFDGPVGLGGIVLAIVVAAAVLERVSRPAPDGGATAPTPLPELAVEGWLNTGGAPGPSSEDLRGRWLVVDSWATDCPPCLRSMPKLADFYRRFRDRGVEMIGLTSETSAQMARIQDAIDRVEGWAWPVGYGAGLVNSQLGATMIPNYVLFDPEGRSVWTGHTVEGLEAAVASRL